MRKTMGKGYTDPVLGTLMNTTNKYEIWIKGNVTTKVRISNSKKKSKKKPSNKG